VAHININKKSLQQRISLHKGDLFEALQNQTENQYDLIICNPPYVDQEGMVGLPLEYLKVRGRVREKVSVRIRVRLRPQF
jgi:tRNA1(Val) A37 N6-methylase TrmN6